MTRIMSIFFTTVIIMIMRLAVEVVVTMMAIVARTAACAIVHLGFTFKPLNPESEALFSRALNCNIGTLIFTYTILGACLL